jgi:NADH dehydrogenase FAD-containing subunit
MACWAAGCAQVTGVERDFIKIKAKDSEEVQNVPYGLCVWSTGAVTGLGERWGVLQR